jgi:Fe-coproporphyrin III synthase
MNEPTTDVSPMGKGVIIPTYACDLRCEYCYASSEVFHRPATMPLREALRAVDFLSALGIPTYTILGGEPTVYKHLPELVSHSQSLGIGPWIVSNGRRLAAPAFTENLLERGLKGGCISLHGDGAASHDAITGTSGSFAASMSAVRLAIARGWPLYPMLTITSHNQQQFLPMVESIAALAPTRIYVNYGVPNIVHSEDVGAALAPEALARITEQLFLAQSRLGVTFIFNREKNKVPLCHFDYDILKDMLEANQIGTGCEAVQGSTVVIEPGGNVLGCSHWVKHPLLNIFRDRETLELRTADEFYEIWRGGRPKQFRDSISRFPYQKCEGCGWRASGKCFGGCKVAQGADLIPQGRRLPILRHEPHPAVVRAKGA